MIEERCRNGHVRTPATTYTNPAGKRHCRLCSGKAVSAGVGVKGRASEVFSSKKLDELRKLVQCMGCGAAPYDTGRKREHQNQHGETTSLPIVTTDHAPGCFVEAQAPEVGRPRRNRRDGRAMSCVCCGVTVVPAVGRTKKYCSAACKSKVLRSQRAQRASA